MLCCFMTGNLTRDAETAYTNEVSGEVLRVNIATNRFVWKGGSSTKEPVYASGLISKEKYKSLIPLLIKGQAVAVSGSGCGVEGYISKKDNLPHASLSMGHFDKIILIGAPEKSKNEGTHDAKIMDTPL